MRTCRDRMKRYVVLLFATVLLSGCSTNAWNNTLGYVLGKEETSTENQPPPQLPDVRKIVADAPSIFDASSKAKNIMIGTDTRLFQTAKGAEFGACVRAEVSNAAGKEMGTAIYRVTVDRGQVSDVRRAISADGCVEVNYKPL